MPIQNLYNTYSTMNSSHQVIITDIISWTTDERAVCHAYLLSSAVEVTLEEVQILCCKCNIRWHSAF